MYVLKSFFMLLSMGAIASAQISCGGGGSYEASDIQADLSDTTIGASTAIVQPQGSGQICIVNRAPSTSVSLTASMINNAISSIENLSCAGKSTCAGRAGQNYRP
ncbi:hypothetical protein F5Y16DRAFT_399196 [Xylariaceae sp. FL0255]|nr:hypothetical protein F5Y16DRAFT_399196 [Xylariaceae sp. FL0255]